MLSQHALFRIPNSEFVSPIPILRTPHPRHFAVLVIHFHFIGIIRHVALGNRKIHLPAAFISAVTVFHHGAAQQIRRVHAVLHNHALRCARQHIHNRRLRAGNVRKSIISLFRLVDSKRGVRRAVQGDLVAFQRRNRLALRGGRRRIVLRQRIR